MMVIMEVKNRISDKQLDTIEIAFRIFAKPKWMLEHEHVQTKKEFE